MPAKVMVRDGEDIGRALARLRREVERSRALNKWPVWAGHYAKPSEKRNRAAWRREMKLKWGRPQQRE